ncbi:MAG: class I SAM-dependent methyltransferase [Gammaproteobacteria bacterium]
MNNKDVPYDDGGVFPTRDSAARYIEGGNTTNRSYHADRIRAIRCLLVKLLNKNINKVVDFGCGDGMYISENFAVTENQNAIGPIERIYCIDKSAPMIEYARRNLSEFNCDYALGGVEQFEKVETSSVDLTLAIDVLGYLSTEERDEFFHQVERITRPGGFLVVMCGNELLDVYALNSGTTAFFANNFDIDITSLLIEGDSPRPSNAMRLNPLNFGALVSEYGFDEIEQSYSQWHKVPPGLGNKGSDLAASRMEMRDFNFDPNELPPIDKWKAMFRCSIFASLCMRRGDS